MKGGFSNIMKQAQQMQALIEQKQRELANKKVTGEAGAGLVKVVMICGNHAVERVEIDPSLKDEDIEVIEDLLAAGFNAAREKAEKETRDAMQGVAGGLKMPGGLNSLFGGE